jgi:hypothetical protein
MRFSSSRRAFALAAFSLGLVSSQQYAGETIPNSLPTTPGAQITYFNIPDGNGGNTTLINYFSFPGGKRQDESKVQRAIIIVHGKNQDPATYWAVTWAAINYANAIDATITEETVSIIAPFFANGDDKGTGYPWQDGQPPGQGSVCACYLSAGQVT